MILSVGDKYYTKTETNTTIFRSLGEGVFIYSIHLDNILDEEIKIVNDGYYECRVARYGEIVIPLISLTQQKQRMIFEVIGIVDDYKEMLNCNLINLLLVDEDETIRAMKMISINIDIWLAWMRMQEKINTGNLEYKKYIEVKDKLKSIDLLKLWESAEEKLI